LNKFSEIGVGEISARSLGAVAEDDVFERPRCHMALEGLDRTAELGSSLRCGLEPTRHVSGGLALPAGAEESVGFKDQSVASALPFSEPARVDRRFYVM